MKKLLATLTLAAAVVGSFAAGSPARADIDTPQMMPSLVQPDLSDLKLRALPQLNLSLVIIKKAELTSQVAVFKNFHPIYNPNPHPAYPVVWCYVKNSGLKDSGWFRTLLRIQRYGPLPILSLPTIEVKPWMSIPVGGYRLFGVRVYAPWGIKRAFSFADIDTTVPEYNEFNNWDSVP
jgi:hypothetical protein